MKTIVLENLSNVEEYVCGFLEKNKEILGELTLVTNFAHKTRDNDSDRVKAFVDKVGEYDNLVVGSSFQDMEQFVKFVMFLTKLEKVPNIYILYLTTSTFERFLNIKTKEYSEEFYNILANFIDKNNVYNVPWEQFQSSRGEDVQYFKDIFFEYDIVKLHYNKEVDIIVNERPVIINRGIHEWYPKVPLWVNRTGLVMLKELIKFLDEVPSSDMQDFYNEINATLLYQKESVELERFGRSDREQEDLLNEKDKFLNIASKLKRLIDGNKN